MIHAADSAPTGLLPDMDPAAAVNPAPPSAPTPSIPPAAVPATSTISQTPKAVANVIDQRSWIESLSVSEKIPFTLSAFPVPVDLSKQWWETGQLKIRFARQPNLNPEGEQPIAWRVLPNGENGALLKGAIRLSGGSLQIFQAIVIQRVAEGWFIYSSPMAVRYVADNGKTEELVSPSSQKGRWRARLDTKGLLIAGWTATALDAARSRLGEFVNDEQLRLTLKTCGEVVFRIAQKP